MHRLLILCLILLGCSNNPGPSSVDSGRDAEAPDAEHGDADAEDVGDPLDDLIRRHCAALAADHCTNEIGCNRWSDPYWLPIWSSREECTMVTSATANCEAALAVEAGNAAVDEVRIRECLSMPSLDCVLDYVECVEGAVVGVAANGESCRSNLECASKRCDGIYDFGSLCARKVGTCLQRLPLGAECASTTACDEGLHCSYSEHDGFRCRQAKIAGQPCEHAECVEPFVCAGMPVEPNTCRARVGLDEVCAKEVDGRLQQYEVCPFLSDCDTDTSATCKLRTPNPCETCEGCDCGGGGRCEDSECVLYVGEGDRCGGDLRCDESMQCVDGICEFTEQPIGANCSVDPDCRGVGLDTVIRCEEGRCAFKAAEGEPCVEDQDCVYFTRCEDGVCIEASKAKACSG